MPGKEEECRLHAKRSSSRSPISTDEGVAEQARSNVRSIVALHRQTDLRARVESSVHIEREW